MSYFVCPHCNHEIDVFSTGGGERTAKEFNVPFLGRIELDPTIREAEIPVIRVLAESRRTMPRVSSRLPAKCWLACKR